MSKKQEIKSGAGAKCLLLSFLLPFAIMLMAFAVFEVYPFGDSQILVVDLYHQYFPFLSELQRKLQNGGSLLYSWNMGLGSGFLPVIAYYTASPLNLLTAFISKSFLREALTLFLLIKIGAAGLCCTIFINKVFGENGVKPAFFGTMYALCGFVLGYYWNVIWMDTAAVLPLVALGVYELVKNGKIRLYMISLFAAVFMNYYIGLFCCIFSAISFFAFCILQKTGVYVMARRLVSIALSSAAALGATGILTVPTYLALKNASGMDARTFPTEIKWYHSAAELFSQMFNFFKPTYMEGLPNIYCGLACVPLALFFLLSRRVSRREKAVTVAILGFFAVGFNLNVLDYILHGFHFPNMLPARFSFLFCFVVIIAAYRAFTLLSAARPAEILPAAALGALIFVLCFRAEPINVGNFEIAPAVLGAAAVGIIAVYATLWILYGSANGKRRTAVRRAAGAAAAVVFMIEMGAAALFSAHTAGTTGRSGYPRDYEQITKLAGETELADSGFYRVEKTDYHTVNDGPLYGYRGITQFSSVLNTNLAKFLEKIGMTRYVANNCYYYRFGSPVINTIFNVKYVIDGGDYEGALPVVSEFGADGDAKSYKNEKYLPIGFVADDGLYSCDLDELNVFDAQSELFGRLSGISANVFKTVGADRIYGENCEFKPCGGGKYYYSAEPEGAVGEPPENGGSDGAADNGKSQIRAIYTMPRSGVFYIYAKGRSNTDITVTHDGQSKRFGIDNPAVLAVGSYEQGDTVLISYEIDPGKSGNFTINAAMLDYAAFCRGFDRLESGALDVYDYSDTGIMASVDAGQGGVLYTSVPYEKGWKLYIDGEQREIIPFQNALVTAQIEAGIHDVRLEYTPDGLYAGVWLTLISAFGGAALFALHEPKTAEQLEAARRSGKGRGDK